MGKVTGKNQLHENYLVISSVFGGRDLRLTSLFTSRPSATMRLPRMASRMTAKASCPTGSFGGDVIGGIEEALVDLRARHKAVDLDRVSALDLDGVELLIRDDEVVAVGDLVATTSVLRRDRHAGVLIDQLLTQAIAGGLVDLPERDALSRRTRRMERNRTGDQSQFEIAFPVT
jgi:hypothetical protein